jgi:hypothetical protein
MAVLQGGMDRAMNTYNVKPTGPDEPCGEPD